MAQDKRFAMDDHIIPVLSPVDIVSTATNTTHIKITGHHVTFLVPFGTITGDSVVVTVEESTSAATTGAVAVPFKYRLSLAVGADSWGAVTTADSTGVIVTASDDDKILLIDIDPSALSDDCNYLSVLVSPEASCSAVEVAALAVQDARYGQLDHVSAT